MNHAAVWVSIKQNTIQNYYSYTINPSILAISFSGLAHCLHIVYSYMTEYIADSNKHMNC